MPKVANKIKTKRMIIPAVMFDFPYSFGPFPAALVGLTYGQGLSKNIHFPSQFLTPPFGHKHLGNLGLY